MRTLQDKHQLQSEQGRIAVGWLIVQDLAMILALILLPAFSAVLGGDDKAVEGAISGPLAFFQPHTLLGALGLTLAKLLMRLRH